MSGVARRSDSPAVTSKRSAKHPDVTELYGDGAMLDVCSRFYNKVRQTQTSPPHRPCTCSHLTSESACLRVHAPPHELAWQIFADPVMGVLFEDHSEPHAWRLAAFFVRQFGGDDEYSDGE